MPTRPTIDVSYGPPGAIASAVEFARRGDTVVATTRNLADSSSFDMRSWIVYVSTAIGVGSRRHEPTER